MKMPAVPMPSCSAPCASHSDLLHAVPQFPCEAGRDRTSLVRGGGEVAPAGRKWPFGVLQGGPAPSCL